VTSLRGHLTEHEFTDAHRKWGSCEPAALFDAPMRVSIREVSGAECLLQSRAEARGCQDGKAIAQNLRQEVRNADMLMIWTDCDREGEHIGSEVVHECRKVNRNVQVKRARFSAIIAA
jgi:DNA topoisomerase-3